MKRVLAATMLLLLAAAPTMAGNITTFGDGKIEAAAELDPPQFVDIINITVPAQCHIRKATMNVSAVLPDKANPDCPEDVQVYLNDTLLWQFDGTDFGAFGHQDTFDNETAVWQTFFYQNGGQNNTTVRLPKKATVQNATLEISCTGWNMSRSLSYMVHVSDDRYGAQVSLAGDVSGDGYVDIIIGFGDYRSETMPYDLVGKACILHGGPGMDNTADLTLAGTQSFEFLGASVSGAGDVNGDGYDDVIVGAPGNRTVTQQAGAAFIYYGGPAMDSEPDVRMFGEAKYDEFGDVVSGAGDLDGDGFDDVVAGSFRNGGGAGRVYVFFGGAAMDNISDVVITGTPGDYLGQSISGAGDVNGDGYDDLVIGMGGNDTGGADAGAAGIHLGGPGLDNITDILLTGDGETKYMGMAVAGAGDVNGDGYDDILAGSDTADLKRGMAHLFLGGQAVDGKADAIFTGEAQYDRFGRSLSAAGDVNADGYDDMLVGAKAADDGAADTGKAYLIFGGKDLESPVMANTTNHSPDEQFGNSVSGAGDLNGDGLADILVGTYTSKAFIYNSLAGLSGCNLSVGDTPVWRNTDSLNGTEFPEDFSGPLNAYLSAHQYTFCDKFGNPFVDVPVLFSAGSLGRMALSRLSINYTYTTSTADFSETLDKFISGHQSSKDPDGNITVPLIVKSATPGRLRLVDLNISADEPPRLVQAIPDIDMDQGALRWDLVDLHTFFQDDYTSAEVLKYSLLNVTNNSLIDVSITGNRYVSVDASMDENWTGTIEVVVACADSQNQSVFSNSFRIYVGEVQHPGANWPPYFTTRWPQTGFVGQELTYDVNATDPENDTLTFGLDNKPQGMTIDGITGLISWVPKAAGTYDVALFATDGCSTVFQNFSIGVPNRPPRLSDEAPPFAHVGSPFLFRVPAVDDDGDALTYTLEPGSDATMEVDFSTGLINWTPTAIGNYLAVLTVSDGMEELAYRCYITVLAGNHAPRFQTVPVTAAYVGLRYNYNANATDIDGDPVDNSLVQGPDGMTLDNSTGWISWMPGGPGNCPVVLKASDGKGGETLQQFTIVVSERVKPRTQITDPAQNLTLKGKVAVTGRTFRGTLDIAKVQVRVDGGSWKDADGSSTWKLMLDTTKLKNGKRTIEARAYDGMDYSDTVSRTVVVDNPKATGKGFIPGFGAFPLLVAAAAILVLRQKMK